jgi:prolipoprotein diacylglyceryltransferase
MLPVIIKTNVLTVYTYGVFVTLALFWFLYVAWKYIRITKHREEEIFDLILFASGIGLFFGRAAYMLFHLDLIVKKGIIVFFAIHLYPGMHGLSVLVFGGMALVIFLARGRKYTGSEVMAYLTPAILTALTILSFGSIFAGTDVGVITAFPVRIKYALYDGLRHTPGLYDGVAFLIAVFVFDRLIGFLRQNKLQYGMIIALFYWLVSFVFIATSQLRDVVTYQKSMPYKLFDLYFAILTLLTSLVFIVYYVRSHFIGMFYHLFGPLIHHGQSIRTKTERTSSLRGSKD